VNVVVRSTLPEDFPGVIDLTRKVYAGGPPWTIEQLTSHSKVFPEGQFVAVDSESGRIVGMAASLIVLWDDYHMDMSWRDFTEGGMFTNHDSKHGRTLYGAEVMVAPGFQRRGIGNKLYAARRDLVQRLGLLRIRAGARLRGYHRYAAKMDAEEYVIRVVNRKLSDPTLSFQLKHGFHVLGVASDYLRNDPESLGYAAVIEWINASVATLADYSDRDPRYSFRRPCAS